MNGPRDAVAVNARRVRDVQYSRTSVPMGDPQSSGNQRLSSDVVSPRRRHRGLRKKTAIRDTDSRILRPGSGCSVPLSHCNGDVSNAKP